MNGIKSLISFFSTIAIIASSCHKNNDPDPDSFYFRCKVDGEDYRPNGCTNCSGASLLGDSTFLFNGNRGYESILIGVIKLDHLPISDKAYVLDQRPEQKGS